MKRSISIRGSACNVFVRCKCILKCLWDLKKAPLVHEQDRRNYIVAKYIFTFTVLLYSIFFAFELANVINEIFTLTAYFVSFAQAISVAVTSTGILGKRAWEESRIKDCSVTKILERKINLYLTLAGFWFSCISLNLEANCC